MRRALSQHRHYEYWMIIAFTPAHGNTETGTAYREHRRASNQHQPNNNTGSSRSLARINNHYNIYIYIIRR